jgi:hypothetical protein
MLSQRLLGGVLTLLAGGGGTVLIPCQFYPQLLLT